MSLTYQPHVLLAVFTALLLGGAVVGCGEEEITVQQVPKGMETIAQDDQQPAKSGQDGPPGPTASANDPLRIWALPEGWRELPTTAPMRLATLMIGDGNEAVEVAITSFPGDVGGDLANVNRWRGQLGLSAVDPSELEGLLERFTQGVYTGYLVRIDNEGNSMLAAAIVSPSAERSWFVRVLGDGAAVGRVAPAVERFARNFVALPEVAP